MDSKKFKDDLLVILDFEGGYANHPKDPGGSTNRGITQKTYDSFKDKQKQPKKDVREITFTDVESIYLDYYLNASCDKIATTHPLTATVHFDFAINAGKTQANKTLQRTVGAKPVDGVIGRISLGAIFSLDDYKTAISYIRNREIYYNALVNIKPDLTVFLKGWLKRLSHLEKVINDRANKYYPENSNKSTA